MFDIIRTTTTVDVVIANGIKYTLRFRYISHRFFYKTG